MSIKENSVLSEAFSLYSQAQKDIIVIGNVIRGNIYAFDYNVSTICRNSAEAVEKMLNGYIKYDNIENDIRRNHNLKEIWKDANNLGEFKNIEKACDRLNKYGTRVRYDSFIKLDKNDVISALKDLKTVYDHTEIKKTRDALDKEEKFNVLPEDINESFIELNKIFNEKVFTLAGEDQARINPVKCMEYILDCDKNDHVRIKDGDLIDVKSFIERKDNVKGVKKLYLEEYDIDDEKKNYVLVRRNENGTRDEFKILEKCGKGDAVEFLKQFDEMILEKANKEII